MDEFGISTAVRSMVEVYCMTARQTGRTTKMLDGLKDGDRLICLSGNEARRLESLCRERGLKVTVSARKVRETARLFEIGTSQGRTVFEHTWVEEFFRYRLQKAEEDLDSLQRELSGYGEAHRKTARQAAMWHGFEPRNAKE